MPAKISRLADFLPYLMAVTSNAVSSRIADEYRSAFGLKVPDWRVMAVLGDAGALTQREMVRATLMDKVAVNRACKVLEERGFARRLPNRSDGRSHHLELTEEGRRIHGEVMPLTYDWYEKIFAGISPAERATLKSLLDRIRDGVRTLGPVEGDGDSGVEE